jgi:acetyl esterase/lipase
LGAATVTPTEGNFSVSIEQQEALDAILRKSAGLPPLIIQAGTHEVLLDDAVRLVRQAATAADVEVTLDITPGTPHVFQAYHPILDEAAAALDRAGRLLPARLAAAERVAG